MASDPSAVELESWKRRERHFRRLGYFECKRILSVLNDFSDLVRHDFGIESQRARRSLEELVPGADSLSDRERLLRAAMNRLIPLVDNVLFLADVDTTMVLEKYESEPLKDPKKVRRLFDLLENYFDLDHRHNLSNYSYVIQALDRGIGVFEHKKKSEFRQLFNPATYLGWCVRFPISVLEKAGLEGDEASSVTINAYGWLVRVVMLAVLALFANRLGIKGAWDKLVGLLARSP